MLLTMPGRAMLLLSVRVMCCEVCVVGYGMGEAAFFAFIVGGMSTVVEEAWEIELCI